MPIESRREEFLGDILALEYGASLPETHRSGGGFPVYGSNGEVGWHDSYLVSGPGIIVGRKGSVGAVAWSAACFWPIDTTYYVVPKDRLNLRWCYWLLRSLPLRRLDSSTGVPGLNRNDVYRIRVLPPPPSEQRRIAEILDTIDATIQQTEVLIAKLKQVKAGLLHDLLTRGLDEQGQLRDPAARPDYFQVTSLGLVPESWNLWSVVELFEMQLGKMLSKAAKTGQSPYPYLANRNVQWDHVDPSDLETMDFTHDEQEKFSLYPGDLLVCEGGEVGRTALWQGELPNCFFQKAIHRLRPRDGRILPGYMLRYMRLAVDYGLLTRFVSQTSITHLTREKLALVTVPVPPIEEQRAIVAILSRHDLRLQVEETYRDKLRQLKQGLMDDLLTGRVRTSSMAAGGSGG